MDALGARAGRGRARGRHACARGASSRNRLAGPRRGVRHRARLADVAVRGPGRAGARWRRGRGEASPIYYRGESVESALDFLDRRRAAARRRGPVRARGHRGAARGRGRRGRRPRPRSTRPSTTGSAAGSACRSGGCSASPRGAAHLVHDRHRLRRGHARPRPPGARVPRAEGQGRRRRGPRAARGGARGVGRAAAGGRQRGLDARGGARAHAGADPSWAWSSWSSRSRPRPRTFLRARRARPSPAGDRGRGLPGPARRGAGRRVRRRDQREARQVGRRAGGCADDPRRPCPRTCA